ncbi:MAG TPA: flagellar hook-basal body complex protein FliE [Nitrospirae bacterium]|nr:flagellar hook-basal body complex protein FliE [bacterium BMS3Abin06]HDH10923.1 flagellar hook-basal body complex protein FliE [Nitrospirota bacterium]HDZ00417.1 flagellar hook-basal body complex protein FliE [Nitrospirota bacterium]
MSDLPIKNIAGNIGAGDIAKTKSIEGETGNNFESVINEALSKVSQVQEDVEKAVNELSTGGDITSAVLAVEKADMSFQLMVEVRNKLISTYQEIMRMQV